jgi:hypothetical protein
MIQLLLHGLGDYLLQNDWMAQHKTQPTKTGYLACFIHALLYSLPFLLIGSLQAFLFIFLTHFLIDKYRLAVYWIKLTNWNWQSTNFGYSDAKPQWMSVWLLIIIDNLLHLICNYTALTFL